MHPVVEVGGDDVWGNGCLQGWRIVVCRCNNSVVKIVVPQSFDGGFVENNPGKAGIPDPHVGGSRDGNAVVASVDQVEVQVQVDGGVVGPQVYVVHEWKEDVLVGSVEGDPGRSGEVDVVLESKAGCAVPVDSLHGDGCTGKK